MSSSSPPYPYYNGIPFNPSFFTSNSGTGLTQSQANGLYLQKTVTDTATALETFSAGIVTNSITSSASNPIKLNDSNNRNVWINSSATASNTVYIGTAGLTTNYIYGGTEINTLGSSNTIIGGNAGGYVSLVSNTVFINASGNGNTTIGTSAGSGTLTVNRPITIGYSIQPVSGQIGHTTYLTINSASNITNYYLFTTTIPATNATFMCNWNFQYALTSNATLNQPQLYLPSDPSQSNGTINLGPVPLIGQPQYYACNGSRTFFSPSTSSSLGIQLTWLPQISASASSGYGSCTLTRIA